MSSVLSGLAPVSQKLSGTEVRQGGYSALSSRFAPALLGLAIGLTLLAALGGAAITSLTVGYPIGRLA